MSEVVDITPEGSAAPVFLDSTPLAPADPPDVLDDTAEREAAAAELVALGLSESRARIVVGLPPIPPVEK